MSESKYRKEHDSMGEMPVPADMYYGAQTARAVENFPISGLRFPREFIRALGMVKHAAAHANGELGLLNLRLEEAISTAAREVTGGRWDDHFPVDIFQTGSGTSTNMNANEVIANRANELLGGKVGDRSPVHPNDHVNMCQSSNDVIPTAIHVAALEKIHGDLLPALERLRKALAGKAEDFDSVVKIGRTHLMDATPVRLGQEFGGYAAMVERGEERLSAMDEWLGELPIGGTAVGTGVNAHPEFGRRVAEKLSEMTGLKLAVARNRMEALGSRDAVVVASGALKSLAVGLMKIANDIRWLGSGPRCGLGELYIQPVQPGSSIMPGKVNPVIAEMVCQVAAQVIGNDASVTVAGQSGNFELNVMMPLMAYNLLQSIALLGNACKVFAEKCVADLNADEAQCQAYVERSIAMITALVPVIGYDRAARLAQDVYVSGKTVRELLLEKKILPEEDVAKVLDPWRMTQPGIPGARG
jgi:fumarate hydratase class II